MEKLSIVFESITLDLEGTYRPTDRSAGFSEEFEVHSIKCQDSCRFHDYDFMDLQVIQTKALKKYKENLQGSWEAARV